MEIFLKVLLTFYKKDHIVIFVAEIRSAAKTNIQQ